MNLLIKPFLSGQPSLALKQLARGLVLLGLGSLSTSAISESLPDAAVWDKEPASDMKDRFTSPPLNQEEMESMYLEAPSLLENAEKRKGSESIMDQQRFTETDLFFRSQRQDETLNNPTPEPVDTPPPPPFKLPELIAPIKNL